MIKLRYHDGERGCISNHDGNFPKFSVSCLRAARAENGIPDSDSNICSILPFYIFMEGASKCLFYSSKAFWGLGIPF